MIIVLSLIAYFVVAGLVYRKAYVYIKEYEYQYRLLHTDSYSYSSGSDGLWVGWFFGSLFWPLVAVAWPLIVLWKKTMLAPTPQERERQRIKDQKLAAEKFLKIQIEAGFTPTADDLAAVGGSWIDEDHFKVPVKNASRYEEPFNKYKVTDQGIILLGSMYR